MSNTTITIEYELPQEDEEGNKIKPLLLEIEMYLTEGKSPSGWDPGEHGDKEIVSIKEMIPCFGPYQGMLTPRYVYIPWDRKLNSWDEEDVFEAGFAYIEECAGDAMIERYISTIEGEADKYRDDRGWV